MVSPPHCGVLTAGGPAVCSGVVLHHRHRPTEHRFTYPVSLVWLDPDDPDPLFAQHPLWSARRTAPVRFRRRDYFDGGRGAIGPALRDLVGDALGQRPEGAVRMLTQPRTWGWLFNPITIYLLWAGGSTLSADGATATPGSGGAERDPVAAVLEVTNTPWKERHRYVVGLVRRTSTRGSALEAAFAKSLHVSPFLDEDYRYRLRLAERDGRGGARRLTVDLDVIPPASSGRLCDNRIQRPDVNGGDVETPTGEPVLTTRLVVHRYRPSRRVMTNALIRTPLPTHRVSFGIHRQAAALWRKGVPFVAHPRRATTAAASSHGEE